MNRTERRRTARRAARRRDPAAAEKQSHRLPTQVCTLYVPDVRGYLTDFWPKGFSSVPFAELARFYEEDEASSAALTFREITGLRVVVRPFYPNGNVGEGVYR